MGQRLAGIDRFAATDRQDHVEVEARGRLAQAGDALGGDFAIEGDVVQSHIGASAGGVEALLDQADHEAVDDHHGSTAAMGQVLACLVKNIGPLHITPG
ncbi:hypothetical protein PPS11_12171 [Pseudomonas putida S11]|nr:hypothetical protein PPS11_12171 [Pseudomonas putida S11]